MEHSVLVNPRLLVLHSKWLTQGLSMIIFLSRPSVTRGTLGLGQPKAFGITLKKIEPWLKHDYIPLKGKCSTWNIRYSPISSIVLLGYSSRISQKMRLAGPIKLKDLGSFLSLLHVPEV